LNYYLIGGKTVTKGISPQLEDKIKRYQTMQQQMSSLQQQIQTVKLEQLDIDKALKEIEELPDDEECYRSIGRLLVKSTIIDTKGKLGEQKDLYNTRVKLAEKSYEKIKKQFEDLETEIKVALESGEK
jgi:prefoldin beta subunit